MRKSSCAVALDNRPQSFRSPRPVNKRPDVPGVGHNSSPFNDEPLQLYQELPKGEQFPVETLGPILGGMAKALHEAAVQSPLAICGTAVLAAAACATQALRNVELPIAGGQSKPLSLYFLTIAQSGERKTATDAQALRPIRQGPQSFSKPSTTTTRSIRTRWMFGQPNGKKS